MITRRDFIKGMVGFSLTGSSLVSQLTNLGVENSESKLDYSVSGIRCSNPCSEIILADSREDAERIARGFNGGTINYSGISNGRKVNGSYRIE